jgi:Domain of unknown function (DUF4956)
MPEWLTDAFESEETLTARLLAVRLAFALVAGVLIAVVYRFTHGRDKADASVLVTTLVLLSVLIAMVSLVIGNSVARAFSLVGALSIVRFRTVVDDTRDTAFVIFSVIVGMAAGTGLFIVPLVGIPIVGGAAVALDVLRRNRAGVAALETVLVVRLGLGHDPQVVLKEVLARHARHAHMVSTTTARQGSAIDVTYFLRLHGEASMTQLPTDLNRIEGIQSVELRRHRIDS